MQIWKALYVLIHIKIIPWKFPILTLGILELFTRKVFIFKKKETNFWRILLFLYACKQTFRKLYG